MPSEIELKKRISAALLERETISHDAYGAKKALGLLRQRDELLRAALASLPDRTGEPVAYASAEQIAALPADHTDEGGAQYLPLRRTPAGKFQMALYASPDAEQARLRERVAETHDEAEARIIQEFRWGNLTSLGVANHLRRAGFRHEVAVAKANALPAEEARLAQQAERATAVTEASCAGCVHWGKPVDDWEHRPLGYRECTAIIARWEIADEVSEHLDRFENEDEWLAARRKALKSAKAVVVDGSQYVAALHTLPDFSCAKFAALHPQAAAGEEGT